MKKIRWQIIIVIIAIAAIGLLLLSQQPEAVLPGIEPQVEVPSEGGKYTEALIGIPGRLNPVVDWANPADRTVNTLIYSSLIDFDSRGLPVGDLADSWGISQDGTIYNFSIRDAIWHDGEPVTSEDITFTIGLLRQDELPVPEDIREFWNQVEVEALDEKVIQFRLPEPFAPFFDFLSFGILPSHIWKGIPVDEIIDSELNLNPVGSGPYRFENFTTDGDEITGVDLTAFKQYFKISPFIEKFSFKYFPDSMSVFTSYEQGMLDSDLSQSDRVMGIGEISQIDLPKALKSDQLGIYTSLIPRLGMVLINLDNPGAESLQDLAVRQSLYSGVNRQKIVDQILEGQAIIANGPIFPASWAYYDGLDEVPFDPEKAVSILRDAGFTFPAEGGDVRSRDGELLEFDLVFPDESPYPLIAQSMIENWGNLGIKVNPVAVPGNQIESDYLRTGNFELALVELNQIQEPDPDPYPFWHQTQASRGKNYSGWNDRQASEYLEVARTQVDINQRSNLYKSFQIRFMNELPSLPLFFSVNSVGIDREIQGVRIGPLYDPVDRFRNVVDWFMLTETEVARSP